MSDSPSATATPEVEPRAFDAAAVARLRSLSRPGHDLKTLAKSVTPFEIAAIAILVALVAGTFLVYSFWILPDQVVALQLSNEVAANNKKIDDLRAKAVDPGSVTSQYQEVKDSLDTFRGSVLKSRNVGKQDILRAIDASVKETGVAFAGSVSFQTSEAVVEEQAAKSRSATPTITSYPSLEVSMSISGTYPQLRSFISKFESSNQFVVINSVSLSASDQREPTEGGGPRGRAVAADTGAGALTLQLEMTAYFQPESAPAALGQ